MHPSPDIAVVGGGIVGLATALALAEDGVEVTVLEAEERVARHQTGHNSGVIHSGLYYPPGSEKARLCAAGRAALYAFCEENGLPHRRCGKLVVATGEDELPRLDELERRGRANGLAGLERLDAAGIREVEPHAAGLAGLAVAETGVVDFVEVARAMALHVSRLGGEIRTGHRLRAVRREGEGLRLVTAGGDLAAGGLVNCAGLQCDRVARLCGAEPDVRIVPFRGAYHELVPAARELVRTLVYPVPDPRFPFLGVHLTRTVEGRVEVGPNAVMALARHGYRRWRVSPGDLAATLAWPGFWRLAARLWRTGAGELWRAMSKRRFAAAAARLVPAIEPAHLRRAGAGVRAQAVDREGRLVDDFRFAEGERSIHVLNAPSPAATAALAIGREVAARARARLI